MTSSLCKPAGAAQMHAADAATPTRNQGTGDGCEEGRKQPSKAAPIEVGAAEAAGPCPLGAGQAGDEKARDHKEDLDAVKAAGNMRKADMEQQYCQDGECSQAVDFRTIWYWAVHVRFNATTLVVQQRSSLARPGSHYCEAGQLPITTRAPAEPSSRRPAIDGGPGRGCLRSPVPPLRRQRPR